jgi:hypothetical protein
MVADTDCPPALVRSDVLTKYAIAEALTFRAGSPYYNAPKAAEKLKEYERDKIVMERNDNNSYQKNTMWDFSEWPMAGGINFDAQDREW